MHNQILNAINILRDVEQLVKAVPIIFNVLFLDSNNIVYLTVIIIPVFGLMENVYTIKNVKIIKEKLIMNVNSYRINVLLMVVIA